MNRIKRIIGRTDQVDFPELEQFSIAVKIDTGAYTSSIHCSEAKEIDDLLHCQFIDSTTGGKKIIRFRNFDIAAVKSSNGVIEFRYSIRSKIVLFNTSYPITLTLTSREDMRFPVLLGRKFLNGKFLVDSQLENLSHNQQHHEH